ncbi:MAG: peptidoglycan-binding protein, partial [Proteobacteria bacterium]|nr:peptidoglycan-binding protein [Pseudomonadota bacterium]
AATLGLKTPTSFLKATLFSCQRACPRQPPDILKKYSNADRPGFYEINEIDGMNNESLTLVIKQFQKDNKLEVSGILDKNTQEKYNAKNFPLAVKLNRCTFVSFENIMEAYGHNTSFRAHEGTIGLALLFEKYFAMGMKVPIRNFSIQYKLNGKNIQTNCVGMSTGMESKSEYTSWTLETRSYTNTMLMYTGRPYFKLLFSVEKDVKEVTVLYNNDVLVQNLNIVKQTVKPSKHLLIKAVPPSASTSVKPVPAPAPVSPPAPAAKPVKDSGDDIIKHIYTHLEYNGYKITQHEKYVELTHPEKWNFSIKKYREGALINGTWTPNDYSKANRLEYLEFVNWLNSNATVTRFYEDKNSDLTFESWINSYEKKNFISFFERFTEDTSGIDKAKYKEFLKFVK